jgi:hypothetical protein
MNPFNSGRIPYDRFLIRRGYNKDWPAWRIIKRALVDSLTQPGFHRFWRVFNPPVGYFTYSLYVFFGGNRNMIFATLSTFLVCGFAHDLFVMIITKKPYLSFSIAYIIFGLLVILSRSHQYLLRQDRWPVTANILVNSGLIAGSFHIAIKINNIFFEN